MELLRSRKRNAQWLPRVLMPSLCSPWCGPLSRTDQELLFPSLIIRDFRFPHRAADDFEFHEPAFEGAVEEGRATAGCQADQLGQPQICGEEVRTPTSEVPLQAVAETRVERGQLRFITETDPIGRVRHQYPLPSWRLYV